MSQKVDGMLLVSRGSTSNLDPKAEQLSSGKHLWLQILTLLLGFPGFKDKVLGALVLFQAFSCSSDLSHYSDLLQIRQC